MDRIRGSALVRGFLVPLSLWPGASRPCPSSS